MLVIGVAILQQEPAPVKQSEVSKATLVFKPASAQPKANDATAPTPVANKVTTTPPINVIPSDPTPTPVVDLRTIAHDRIIADGWNEEQVTCFGQIADEFFGWDISEDELNQHITTIESNYISFCEAYIRVHHWLWSPTPPGI